MKLVEITAGILHLYTASERLERERDMQLARSNPDSTHVPDRTCSRRFLTLTHSILVRQIEELYFKFGNITRNACAFPKWCTLWDRRSARCSYALTPVHSIFLGVISMSVTPDPTSNRCVLHSCLYLLVGQYLHSFFTVLVATP